MNQPLLLSWRDPGRRLALREACHPIAGQEPVHLQTRHPCPCRHLASLSADRAWAPALAAPHLSLSLGSRREQLPVPTLPTPCLHTHGHAIVQITSQHPFLT